jgi:hypothetical protein
MARTIAVLTSLMIAGAAAAQCQPWYPPYPGAVPAYPLSPALWGAPAPKPLPVALPPAPKRPPRIIEEDEPAVPPKPAGKKNGTKSEAKDDSPRIPKVKIPLPGDAVDKPLPKEAPKTDAPKKDAPVGKAVEQFVIPADGKGEPRAEVKVGFFNHSDRDIALTVNGESVKLPSEEYVTLRLPRTFSWAEKGAKATDVVVPPDADGIEIVFRR